ncbi:MAG: zinc ABC transporter substrate-binding protein, partial [Candidatus Magasanikbacteria bacterium]|nr:zinc ABC transporter substrate-binding protein [Candidatus Magasanikbacteria bacterium]
STQDIAKIEDSAMLVLNGGKLEAWGEQIKENLQGKQTLILTVGENIATKEIEEDGEKIQDPHIWLDPVLAKKEVEMIANGLAQVDPANNEFYQANATQLLSRLDTLDTEFNQGLKSCIKRDIITSHAAFGYLAAQYQLNQVAISGLSPDSEPSVQKLTQVAEFAKKNQIKYIFFESLVSPKLSQTIASEMGAQTLVLNPIEGLSDEEIKNGKSYFSEMENNLKNIKMA